MLASAYDYNELVRAATLSSAAYDGCQIQAFDVNITQQVYDVGTDTQGYIGFTQDFANDMDTTPITPVLSGVNFPPGTQVMNGVYLPWSSLSYISLAQNFPEKNITSNALAAFAIGNDVFANFGSSQQGELRRGNNVADGVPNTYPQFTHYGIEFYGNGTLASTVQCEGETDPQCSAGNGLTYITPGHFFSYGIELGTTGCGGGIPSVPTK
ncbi:MAG: hypothetical protein Q9165_005964 [Trypethelium subeluteriae]